VRITEQPRESAFAAPTLPSRGTSCPVCGGLLRSEFGAGAGFVCAGCGRLWSEPPAGASEAVGSDDAVGEGEAVGIAAATARPCPRCGGPVAWPRGLGRVLDAGHLVCTRCGRAWTPAEFAPGPPTGPSRPFPPPRSHQRGLLVVPLCLTGDLVLSIAFWLAVFESFAEEDGRSGNVPGSGAVDLFLVISGIALLIASSIVARRARWHKGAWVDLVVLHVVGLTCTLFATTTVLIAIAMGE
jgi:hypothetical protein